jgi:hypothetical protein
VSWEIWDPSVDDMEHVLKNVVQFQLLMKTKKASIEEKLLNMGSLTIQGLRNVLKLFSLMKGRKNLLIGSEHGM